MKQLTILGLGLWSKHLTNEAQICLNNNMDTIVLQTEKCYLTQWLEEQNITIKSMDDCYEEAEDFDALQISIIHKLMRLLEENETIVYVVPGSVQGISYAKQLFDECKNNKINIHTIEGIGLAQAAQTAAGAMLGWTEIAQSVSVVDFDNQIHSAHNAWCIVEIDSIYWATTAKLNLMKYYADDWSIILAIAQEETFVFLEMPLYQLDQQLEEYYSHRTCILVSSVPFKKMEHYSEQELIYILECLRAPNGCPWDREQTHYSIRNALIEETYELKEAIEQNDDVNIIEELGDVLMLVYFHILIGEEQGRFSFEEVCTNVCEKLIYRHPHVFQDNRVNTIQSVEQNQAQWDELKRKEKGQTLYSDSINDVPKAFPALLRAQKVLKRASASGFDYSMIYTMEQMIEILQSIFKEENEQTGELLLVIVELLRKANINVEEALAEAIDDFSKRFANMEYAVIADGKQMDDLTCDNICTYWK